MKAKYILLALGATLLSTSCSDFLQEDPKGQLTPTTFFATQEELDMATYALYSKVCQTQTNTNPTIPSWQGDDLTANPGSNKQAYAEVDAFHPANDNKGVEAAWSTSYVAIKAANYIIENGGKTPTTDEEINIVLIRGNKLNLVFIQPGCSRNLDLIITDKISGFIRTIQLIIRSISSINRDAMCICFGLIRRYCMISVDNRWVIVNRCLLIQVILIIHNNIHEWIMFNDNGPIRVLVMTVDPDLQFVFELQFCFDVRV